MSQAGAELYTTVVIDNRGKVYDLGAGERVPSAKEDETTWGRNAFTCPASKVEKLRSSRNRRVGSAR